MAVAQHTENTPVLLFHILILDFDRVAITLRLEHLLGKIAMFVWCKKAGILATFISSEIGSKYPYITHIQHWLFFNKFFIYI